MFSKEKNTIFAKIKTVLLKITQKPNQNAKTEFITDFVQFHANATDRTGSICAFKRHQNYEKTAQFFIEIRPLSNDTQIMKKRCRLLMRSACRRISSIIAPFFMILVSFESGRIPIKRHTFFNLFHDFRTFVLNFFAHFFVPSHLPRGDN